MFSNKIKILLLMIITMSITTNINAEDFKIMTYNIYGGRLADGAKLGANIKAENPDFIALQEVDKNTNRSKFKDIAYDMSQVLGYNYFYFQKARNFDGGEFGIAFISKYPITKIYTYELPSIGSEKRQVLAAEIDEKVFNSKILLINTHLDFKEEIKPKEIESLLSITAMFDADIKFMMGDFNLLPTSEYYNDISKDWEDSYMLGSNINDLDNEKRKVKNPRIDYIWGDSSKKWKVKESYFIKETNGNKWTDLSDHLPYVTVFSIEVPKIEIPKVETQKVEVPKEDIKEENIEN